MGFELENCALLGYYAACSGNDNHRRGLHISKRNVLIETPHSNSSQNWRRSNLAFLLPSDSRRQISGRRIDSDFRLINK